MDSSRFFFFFFFITHLFVISQEKSPFVVYDFDKDSNYKKKITALKKIEKKSFSMKTFFSIADLSYYYKDWETAINYYEKIIIEYPSAENYFKHGVSAARKSLEVPRFFSVPYVLKAKKSILSAHRLAPQNTMYLKLLIKLLNEIPKILGGNKKFARKKGNELFLIDPIQGFMIKGYLDDNDNNLASAKSNYMLAFEIIKNNFESYERFLKESERNLIFEIGSAVSNHKIFKDLGITALKFYAKTYDFIDNYPLESVYYRLALIYLSKRDLKSSSENLSRALIINPNYQNALDFKKKHKL
tara:strand:- start:821 stop:1720 length:900 start_codon:yes stop_codon:yes gene_type:complete